MDALLLAKATSPLVPELEVLNPKLHRTRPLLKPQRRCAQQLPEQAVLAAEARADDLVALIAFLVMHMFLSPRKLVRRADKFRMPLAQKAEQPPAVLPRAMPSKLTPPLQHMPALAVLAEVAVLYMEWLVPDLESPALVPRR